MDSSGESTRDPGSQLWGLIERSHEKLVAENTSNEGIQTPDEEASSSLRGFFGDLADDGKLGRFKRVVRVADVLGFVVWSYLLLFLFGIEVDQWIFETATPWAYPFWARAVVFVALLLLGMTWGSRTGLLFTILYAAFFPALFAFVRFPVWLYRKGSWIGAFFAINALAELMRSAKYNLIAKPVALVLVVLVLVSDERPILWICTVLLTGLLLVGLARVLKRSVSSAWFLDRQASLVSRLFSSSKPPTHLASIPDDLSNIEDIEYLSESDLNQLTISLTNAAIVHRFLYLWSHQLREYGASKLTHIFNVVALVWLYLGSAVTFGVINVALFKLEPSQFRFASNDPPSSFDMFVYGVSTLAFNDGAGVASGSGLAHVFRLLAGVFAVVGLLTLVVGLVTVSGARSEVQLKTTERELKKIAESQADLVRNYTSLTVDELQEAVVGMQRGLYYVLRYIAERVPNEASDRPGGDLS